MATRLVLEFSDLETGKSEVRIFHASPIVIGAAFDNDIRIEDPRVAGRQGLFFFTSSAIKYIDCSPTSARHGKDVVSLAPLVPFQIGPVEFRARVEDCVEAPVVVTDRRIGLTLLADEMDMVFRSVALTACAVADGNAGARADIARRAMQLLGVVASLASQLRRNDDALWTDAAEIRDRMPEICDALTITDFLLDPDGSSLRIEDLRRRFIDLARWESLAPVACGSA